MQRLAGAAALLLVISGCREGSQNQFNDFVPILASPSGTQGCTPPAGTLSAVPVTLGPATAAILGPGSSIAGVAGSNVLFLTGSDASVHELDFTGGDPPVDTTLVAAGVITSTYLIPALQPSGALLSGITVFDSSSLIVAEHTSNTLVRVDRGTPDTVANFAGVQSATGGFGDGEGQQIFFRFTEPVSLFSAADHSVYVADTGNHALRNVARGTFAVSLTIAGVGSPGFEDGDLAATRFDTPSGLAVTCPGEMIVTESGAAGFGGNRLRLLSVGGQSFFGGTNGSSLALAGDGGGTVSSEGIDTVAGLAGPVAVFVASDGAALQLVFWIDSVTGILRRYDFATGLSDCPLGVDCASAGGTFTAGGHFSIARTSAGTIYVLDGDAGTLFRVAP